ncbi:CHC2 zinc finger domain-containing protein, partial [Candidatus Phytoplasma pruni]
MNSLNATKIRQDFSMHVLLKKLNILPPHSHPDYRFPCPIHKGNNPTTCRINDYNKIYCFKCAKSYDVIDVYSTLHQTPFKTTLIRLNQFLQDPEYQELLQQKPSHNKQQPRSG